MLKICVLFFKFNIFFKNKIYKIYKYIKYFKIKQLKQKTN